MPGNSQSQIPVGQVLKGIVLSVVQIKPTQKIDKEYENMISFVFL